MEYATEVTGALYVGLFTALGAAIVFATLFLSRALRSERYGRTPAKDQVYECGEDSLGDTKVQFNLNYYLFAMLFVIFDVEAALLYPWATAFDALGIVGVIEVMAFLVILLSGFVYALWKGALKWVY